MSFAAARRVAMKNGPAAALLVGYVQPHFFHFAFVLSVLWSKKVGLDAPSKRQSGSDRLAGGPF